MGLIRFLAILVIIYYVLKILARIFFPIIAKKVVKKAEEQFKQHQNQYNQQNQNTTTSTSDLPKEKKKVGEYIDYEEVD